MSVGVKATLTVIALLVVGAILGAVGQGVLSERRVAEIDRLRGEGGFVEHMHDLLQPKDSAQWEQFRPLVEAADRRNRGIVEGANESMRGSIDSLRLELAPLLDQSQMDRLDGFIRQPAPRGGPPGMRGGGREGGRGEGPPPDGMGPPPGGRRGPPPEGR